MHIYIYMYMYIYTHICINTPLGMTLWASMDTVRLGKEFREKTPNYNTSDFLECIFVYKIIVKYIQVHVHT
jgi:hypothetical protein